MTTCDKIMAGIIKTFTPGPNDEILSESLCDWALKECLSNKSNSSYGSIKMKKHRSKKWRNGKKK